MIRKIITIDQEKCNACGLCVSACHEGAIGIKDGKARLLHEHYCDGLGNCLPVCPAGAISFEEREALAFDEHAVTQHGSAGTSQLKQWPIQIKLTPVQAPYFENADVLIAADCSAYTYPHFHTEFMSDRITLIGCPKLDSVDYSEKLSAIFKNNRVKSVTVVRMEVPCCGGIEWAVSTALSNAGNTMPLQVITLSIKGLIVART
jgi:NAD-dependent dihydropyrimidine dehydrogenase PreA subunit